MPRKKGNKKTSQQEAAAKTSIEKLSDLNQVHGKNDDFSTQKVTLDQIWGDNGTGKYKTLDVDVYTEQLDEMNKSDLQSHATRVGIIPIDNKDLLKKRLITEFQKHVSAYSVPQNNINPIKLTKEAKKILSEGR
tara:strand:+ start:187 stop:588 length:402 start_codon:yes stop_codon:yes gene_type:complete